jgi:hypothetical protein
MNTEAIVARLESQLAAQERLAGGDPAAEAAVDALITALGPALRQATLELAEQAAAEISAQLPSGTIQIVLNEGEPGLVYQGDAPEPSFMGDDLEARMTVRLPSNLKAALEEAAAEIDDSVNSYVVKSLASSAARVRKGRRVVRETLET